MTDHQPNTEQPPTPEPTHEALPQPGAAPALLPAVYVASRQHHEAGQPYGDWISANQTLEELAAQIQVMLDHAPALEPLQWVIHDQEDFAGIELSESQDLETVSRLAAGLAAYGRAFAAFATWHGLERASSESFQQHYRGRWESAEAFADQTLRNMGAEEYLEQVPGWIRPYLTLDINSFARDLESGADVHFIPNETEGGVYVFDTHGSLPAASTDPTNGDQQVEKDTGDGRA